MLRTGYIICGTQWKWNVVFRNYKEFKGGSNRALNNTWGPFEFGAFLRSGPYASVLGVLQGVAHLWLQPVYDVLLWIWALWLLWPVDYGRNDIVPVSEPRRWENGNFHLLCLEDSLGALSCHARSPTTPMEAASLERLCIGILGYSPSWAQPSSQGTWREAILDSSHQPIH